MSYLIFQQNSDRLLLKLEFSQKLRLIYQLGVVFTKKQSIIEIY
ncbi:hypothetical protein [Nodularia chucula]